MDKVELRKLIQEETEASAERYFGLMKEWFSDHTAFLFEGQRNLDEKMDRQFAEVKEDLEQIKRNTDTNSLEILALQEKDRESWRKTAQMEQEYKLLDKRVTKLETNYNYV